MAWLTTNWFWILIFIAFIGMHLFGHGGHGGHGRQRGKDGNKNDDAESRTENGRSGGHQH